LSNDPLPKGSKPLKGDLSGHYRLKVGSYRIIYKIEKMELTVFIAHIGHRKEVYR